jgi:hypothetical protein
LSLRVFGEDITVAGRQASMRTKGKSKANEDEAHEAPVPETDTDPKTPGAPLANTVENEFTEVGSA